MLRCAAFDGGIKICRSLPLDFLNSAGFLDQRAILLAVMGLTKNAGNGICNWCLFSMQHRSAYPFGLSCLPPLPLLHGWSKAAFPLALSLPLQAQGYNQGTWEVKQLGQGTILFLLAMTPKYMVKKHTSPFSKLNAVCYWSWMMTIDWASLFACKYLFIPVQLWRNIVNYIAGLVGHDQLFDTHIY